MDAVQPSAPLKAGPSFENKFKVLQAQQIIKDRLTEALTGQTYSTEASSELARHLADDIKAKLKAVVPPQYKLIVQVLFSEQRGQGLAFGFRGFWDTDTDNVAQATFTNESIVAVGIVYAIYSY